MIPGILGAAQGGDSSLLFAVAETATRMAEVAQRPGGLVVTTLWDTTSNGPPVATVRTRDVAVAARWAVVWLLGGRVKVAP